MYRNPRWIVWLFILWTGASAWQAKGAPERDLQSDTWAATDSLRRRLPMAGECRAHRTDRYVGIFYFVWQGSHGTTGPYDISKLLAANAEHPAWGPAGAFHWWGEPQVGYFLADDPWVIRKNLSMLQDAGVDVLLLDVTNAFTYPRQVQALGEVARQMRAEGNSTPQIAFVTHANGAGTVQKLYEEFYSRKLFPELWFRWQGKPLILGDKKERLPDGKPLSQEVLDFFTWRYSWAWDPGQDKWPWIDNTPQRYGWHVDAKTAEEAPAAAASHPVNDIGRSDHDGHEPPLNRYNTAAEVDQGLHFAEQLKRLLEIDPEFAFIDGWNEWVAQRFVVQPGQKMDFVGKSLQPGDTFFVDAYNEEFSRDIEPMKGGYGDNYYYQMAAAIRGFKGVRPPEKASSLKTIRMDGHFKDWLDVRPQYLDTVGDTAHRDWNGWGKLHYENTTGRNDITSARVACDSRKIYFYAHTREPLTPHTDRNWMLLLIDADQNHATGWNGYDYVANARVIDSTTTTLKRLSDGKEWRIPYRAVGNEMEIAIPRGLMGQAKGRTAFDFHWVDNAPIGGDINEFWVTGDSAPDGRFNYRYEN